MNDLALATKPLVALFVITSLLHTGLGLSVADVYRSLRDLRVVIGALLGNFVLVPLVAILIARLFDISDGLHLGLLLVSMSAGAPFLPRLVELGRGNVALGVGVMVLLLSATLIYLPLVLPQFAPGVQVEPWAIAKPVLILMLMPLVAGMAIRSRWASIAARFLAPLQWISRIALMALVILLIVLNFDRVQSVLGSGALVAAAMLVVSAIGIGFVSGWTSSERRRVLALATGQRGTSAALLIATHVAQDPDAAVMVVMFILIGELILFPAAAAAGRWLKPTG